MSATLYRTRTVRRRGRAHRVAITAAMTGNTGPFSCTPFLRDRRSGPRTIAYTSNPSRTHTSRTMAAMFARNVKTSTAPMPRPEWQQRRDSQHAGLATCKATGHSLDSPPLAYDEGQSESCARRIPGQQQCSAPSDARAPTYRVSKVFQRDWVIVLNKDILPAEPGVVVGAADSTVCAKKRRVRLPRTAQGLYMCDSSCTR